MILLIIAVLAAFLGTQKCEAQVNYRLSQPQIYLDDGHIYIIPAEHRNLVLVANGTGKIIFNQVELATLVSSVKNSSRDLEHFKRIFGAPTNTSAGLSQRITSLEQTLYRLNLVDSLDSRLSSVERQLNNGSQTAGGDIQGNNNLLVRIRRLRNRIDAIETSLGGLSTLSRNPCSSTPCGNGGSCIPTLYGPFCWCREGWEGPTCTQDVNECSNFHGTDLGCQNQATCVNKPGGYECQCRSGWVGIHCTRRSGDCSSGPAWELCGHGICVNQHSGSQPFTCICEQGWRTDGRTAACTLDIDECTTGHPSCSVNPPVVCINTPGSYVCGPCPAGYTGNGHRCTDVNECLVNNGGCSVSPFVQCINTQGSRSCGECPPGFMGNGVTCQYVGMCHVNNGGCHQLARCMENPTIGQSFVQCICPPGYVGYGMGPNGCVPSSTAGGGGGTGGSSGIGPPVTPNPCAVNPCANGGRCTPLGGSAFSCMCMPGFTGITCQSIVNPCQSQPCLNGGTCVQANSVLGFTCRCDNDFTGDFCQEQVESCGGRLTTEEGVLRYPHNAASTQVDGTYHANIRCTWTIRTTPGKAVNMTFSRFHLEGDGNCDFDSLAIRDGDGSGTSLGKFCGESLPNGGNVVSTHNEVTLIFSSDHSITGLGFEMMWNTSEPVCGGLIANQTHGSFNSPGYPGNYPHDRDCVWDISVSLGKRIQLVFATFRIEEHEDCNFDFVEIRDGWNEHSQVLAKYCNSTLPPPLISSGPYLSVRFHTDSSQSDRGFHITFAEVPGVPGCGGVLTSPVGVFSSPQHPEPYAHGLECDWLIRLPYPDDRISLTFLTFQLEGGIDCVYDSVEVHDGNLPNSPLVGRYCGRILPPSYISQGSSLLVTFKSDESVAFGGFSVKYEATCGGMISSSSGVIKSPYYPQNYPQNRECIYVISQPPGKAILFDFQDFDVEGGIDDRCYFDYVEIRDGDNANSSLIGHYCGPPDSTPGRVLSTFNYLWVKFKTDGSVQNRGFFANFSTVDTGCGGILRASHGIITSPGHPEVYPHGVTCTWIIRGEPGQIVRLNWASFSLETTSNCRYDYVQLWDNSTVFQNGTSMGRYCGSDTPPILTTSDNTMTIVFRSDHSVAHDGFMANYVLLNSSSVCGGEFFTEYGVIRSPRYPELYPLRKTCIWKLRAATGRQFMLNVQDFELENGTSRCIHDYLEIRNGAYENSPLIGRYCGTVRPPTSIPSFSNTMYLKFVSDSSVPKRGFMIVWDATATGCGGTLNAPQGSLMSPNYPQAYGGRSECIWTIEVSKGSSIQMVFADLDIQRSDSRTCYGEYIEIRDGKDRNARVIGKYCHSDSVFTVNSTGNSVRIKFVSGYGISGRGFHLNYIASCNTFIKGFHGVIESPNFPNPYPHNRNCTWTILAPSANAVNISFSHFDVEQPRRNNCIYDFVGISEWKRTSPDGSTFNNITSLGKFCGDNRPSLITSSKDTVAINFVSDHSLALNGFRLEWKVHGCGGRLVGAWGSLKSPNYPNKYPHGVECMWHITTEIGTKVSLTIYDLDIERANNCYFDALVVYGGPDENSPELAKICQSTSTHSVITSNGNNMFVKFYSDSSVPGKGFRATYSSAPGGCGGRYVNLENGFVMSPNYPGNYAHNEDCMWYIYTDPNHVVELSFMDFEVERHINCSYDYVAVYDGSSIYAPQILTHCGNTMPEPAKIRSTGNAMVVRLRTDTSQARRGFKANFTRGCGARITGRTSGTIVSPNWPGSLPPETNCSWILIGPSADDRVTLTFTSMGLVPSEEEVGCETTFLEVLDGEDFDAPSLGKFCSTTLPPSFRSSGNALVIRLVTLYYTGLGFRAVYDHSSGACGGQLFALNGSFTSPNYPLGYPPNMECTWEISVSQGSRIELSFRRFELEASDFCNNDFLEIHEDSPAGTLIGHFCGNEIPGNLTAANKLWILFRTDSEGQAPGFWADFNLLHGNELSGPNGVVESPMYPSPGTLLGTFTWRITVNESRSIGITFDDLDFETYQEQDNLWIQNCLENGLSRLTIYDGYDADAPVLKRICVGAGPDPVTSSGNVVFIEYVKTYWQNWWKLSWNEIQASNSQEIVHLTNITGCGGNFSILEGNITTLLSPYYPLNYLNNLRCIWGITSPPHTRIKLRIEYMSLESHPTCSYDKLEVYDGREGVQNFVLNTTLCQRTDENQTLLTSGRFGQLIMQSDADTNLRGFNISVSTECGGYLREPSGRITSPGYPGNYVRSNCEWFVIVRPGRTIQVTFESLDIYNGGGQECVTDKIFLRNGGTADSPFLGAGRYCGNTVPTIPETTGNKLYVKFTAATHSRRGFALTYSEVSVGCGGEIYLTSETPTSTISSPNFPQIPPSHTECEWFISAPQGKEVQLTFEIQFQIQTSVRCVDAGIELRDGGTTLSPEIGTFCRLMPGTQKSTGNLMYVRYYTNVPEPGIGFKAEAKIASCGGTIMATWSGTLTSPGYPDSYDTNLNCTWTLRTLEGSYLQIDSGRTELSLNDPNCTKDRVLIYEELQPGQNFARNWTWCRQSNPRIETSSNVVYIRFESDNIQETRRGFQLFYRIRRDSCGETMRTPTGIIQSPGYPQAYPHNRYCTWRIIAPEDRRIRLEFLDFDLEETYVSATGKKFCYDTVSVYQGQWRDLPPLYNKTLCGPSLPPPVETTSNRMSIYFNTDGSLSHRGFRARYTTELPRLCGGPIPLSNGSLGSPNTTTGTPNTTTNIFCDWSSEQAQDSLLPFRGFRGYSTSSNGTTIVTIKSLEMGSRSPPDPHCSTGFLHVTPLTGGFRYKKHCETGSNQKVYLPSGGISVDWETEDPSFNFSLTYETSPCGGKVFGSANITSPPSTGREIECIWILESNWGTQMRVFFTDIDIDDHRNAAGECDRDFVLVKNGKTQSSPELGRFCGSSLPPDITSMTNSLWIEYHKVPGGSSSNRRGFKLTSEEVSNGCGGVIHTKYGQIVSPNLANSFAPRRSSTTAQPKYQPNTECEWIIETVPGYSINLVFLNRFEIETSQNCTNDFVQVWSKNGKNNPSLWSPLGQKMCGRQLPSAINTTSTSIRVLFRSNENAAVGDGFTLAWYSACGGIFGGDDTSGVIQSAHYNTQNHSNWQSSLFWGPIGWESTQVTRECDYVIQGKEEKDFIVVEFLRPFDVNVPASYGWSLESVTETCPYVNVSMREGNASQLSGDHQSGVFCGNEPPPVFVGNGAVTIMYNYRPVYQNLGWRAKYAIYRCGGEITSPGRISSPGHPFTSAPNMNCTWKVVAPANRVVRFKFEHLQLEFHTGCEYDFVKLFDGDSIREDKLLGTFCGNMSDDFHRFSSKSNILTVQFRTDWSIQHGGFAGSVDFSVGEQLGCGGTKNVTGNGNPVGIQSVDSDGNNRYDEYLDCQWLISGPDYQALEISFETFNVEARQNVGDPGKNVSSEDCPYDYLEIRDGPGPFSQLLGKFCGGQAPPAISSSQNFMWIRFVTDGSNSFSGFRARINNKPSPCGRIFALNATKDVQVLTSPGYPSPYGRNIRCKWTIDGASFFDEVDIRFIELDIPSSPDCSGDRLEIKDVLNSYTSPEGIEGPILFSGAAVGWRHRRLGLDASILQDLKYCGTDTPPDFFSVGRSAELVFQSTSSSTTSGKGFKIEYKAAACNRTFDDIQGRIFSPEYPSHSPIFTSCQFSIRSPTNGSFISLYFNKFMLPGIPQDQGTECVVSAFEVRESTANGAVIAKYCGSSRPNPVFSRSSVLWVKYYTKVEISRGYDITYTSTTEGQGCGGFIFHTGGSFTSPFFPGNFSQNSDCRWRVRVPSALRIQIEFTTFSLIGNCATDFVEILSADSHYPSAAPALVTRFCMGDIPSTYIGSTDSAVIRYKTSANNTSPGWRAEFKGVPASRIPQAST